MNREDLKVKAQAAGKYVEQKAEEGIVAAESRWPVGVILVVALCSFVLGLYVRGLFH